jgi:translation initiation factor 2 alpha subunit (eIF-2alpha)
MIWEVDENIDGMIDFDELQLTYFRNINDTTKNEPCMFFRLLEVCHKICTIQLTIHH